MALRLPLVDGDRVRLRDGREAIIQAARGLFTDNRYAETVLASDTSNRLATVYRQTGTHVACGTSSGYTVVETLDPLAPGEIDWSKPIEGEIDWSKPIEGVFEGRVIPAEVSRVCGPGDDHEYEVSFSEPWSPDIKGLLHRHYRKSGEHRDYGPSSMPVIRNVVPTNNMKLVLPIQNGQRVQFLNGKRGRVIGAQGSSALFGVKLDDGTLLDKHGYRDTGMTTRHGDYSPRNVAYNVGVPGGTDQPIRTRVRKAPPTLDQNFKELATLVMDMRNDSLVSLQNNHANEKFDRLKFLLRQIINQLATDKNVDGTIADMYDDARREAQKIIDDALAERQREREMNEEAIAAASAEFESNKLRWLKEHNDKVLLLEADYEKRVNEEVEKRIDQMYGRTAIIKRKRPIKVKVKVDDLDKA